VSPYLICYPAYIKTRLIGRPVSASHISRRWAECVVKAGYAKGQYWLYDLRKKSMTDEQRKQGTHNKGGHKNESTRERYILDEVPMRSTTVLAALPRADLTPHQTKMFLPHFSRVGGHYYGRTC
jgi:hypothetical protein